MNVRIYVLRKWAMTLNKFQGRKVEISERPNSYELFTGDVERLCYVHSENLYLITIRGNKVTALPFCLRTRRLAELHVTDGRHVGN